MDTVIYHSATYDGIFCREIARHFLQDSNFIGWKYGDAKIPMPSDGMVYILDIPPDCLVTPDKWDRVIWIDHNEASIRKWPDSIRGYRINGVASCRLTYQWFRNSFGHSALVDLPDSRWYEERCLVEPFAVRLVGEYYVFDKRDTKAELFVIGLGERKEWLWDLLLTPQGRSEHFKAEDYVNGIIEDGRKWIRA